MSGGTGKANVVERAHARYSSSSSKHDVADGNANGVWLVRGRHFRVECFIRTGLGGHALKVSRDGRSLDATNRAEGRVSAVRFASGRVAATWRIPGSVSADGKVLWLTGHWNDVVYQLSTVTGRLLAKIPVGAEPHGLPVWPQVGRFLLGCTGERR